MHRVRLITDPFDLSAYSEHKCEDLLAFLETRFVTWPETARLYRDTISAEHDITPKTEEDITALQEYEGEGLFYVVVYPGDPITAIITAVATLALTAVILLFFTPRLPSLANNTESSNNSLGNRVNKPRPNGRVPDIFGTVISVPELLTVPLLFFENNLERELCYMCVGRGDHEIEAVKDGDTPIEQIAGASAKFYGPNTSPNSGVPILEVGGNIDQPLMDVIRLNDVNGQILRAPNANQVSGDEDIRFVYPDTIQRTGSDIDFTTYFAPGDQLTVTSGTFDSPATTITLTSEVRFVYPNKVEFVTDNPSTDLPNGSTVVLSNASYAGQSKSGGTTFVDLSGSYTVIGTQQYTNLQRFSEDFGNIGIVKENVTILADATIAPDGNLTADKIRETAATGNHRCGLATVIFQPGVTYRHTVYLSPDERTFAFISFPETSSLFPPNGVIFELTGAGSIVTSAGLDSASIERLPNGWYKCSIVAEAQASGSGRILVGPLASGDALAYPGVAGSGIFAWGAMTQANAEVRPYIPTGTVAASRYYLLLLDAPSVNPDWNAINTLYEEVTGPRNSIFTRTNPSTTYNLNGTYNVVSVSAGTIVLTNPSLVNPAWNNINDLPGGATDYVSPSLSTSGERWVGPFIVDMPSCDRVLSNIVALQGMYLVTKKGKYRPRSVTVAIEITPVDENDLAIGPAQTFNVVVYGDGQDRSPQGVSLWSNISFTGRCSIRARRLTYLDLDTEDTIVDEVKWRDCFGTAIITQEHFGDVTTVHSLTLATSGATSVKERKLNCRATRKVLERNIDDTFGPGLVASRNAADIICHMTLDPFIGGRSADEIDIPLLYDTVAEVVAHFGIPQVGEFSHTFDQDGTSYEEMVQAVAQAVFCTAYRQGSTLRLFFERETNDSTLLFNHRNKVPGSEQRTVRFGNLNDHDGVEFDYISPVDGSKLTLFLPADQSATKPKKLEMIGVQSEQHAFLHAARAWNKIRFQHTTAQFSGLSEASQLVLSERIEVTDNTRPDVFDGEVVSQDGLSLELSQPFEAANGVSYAIFLQLPSGTVEVIDIVPGADPHHVTLQSAPSEALVTDAEAWAVTTYQIVGDDGGRSSAFLLTEKGSYNKRSIDIQAINYDPRYYRDDLTYKD